MPEVWEKLRDFAEQSGDLPSLVDARRYLEEEPPQIEPVIPGVLDMADKSFVVGPSKCRKSFFVLQMALCIATGKRLFSWEIPDPKRVAIVQYELKEPHYWRRVRRMAEGLGITGQDLSGRLHVLNARGFRPSINDMRIADADVVIIDPFYKLLSADGRDENAAVDVGAILGEVDSTIKETGASGIIVHHTTKGRAGDKSAIDRAAGSGTIARDFDGCFTLVPHRHEPDAVVVETLLRNYPSPEPFTVQWEWDAFVVRPDLEPEVETSLSVAHQRQAGASVEDIIEWAGSLLREPLPKTELHQRIAENFRCGKKKADEAISALARSEQFTRWKSKGDGVFMIGQQEHLPPGCKPHGIKSAA